MVAGCVGGGGGLEVDIFCMRCSQAGSRETLAIDSKSIDLALLSSLMITNVCFVRFVCIHHFTNGPILVIRTYTGLLCVSSSEIIRYLFSI